MLRKIDIVFFFPIRVVFATFLVCWMFIFAVFFAIFVGTDALIKLKDTTANLYIWSWNPKLRPGLFVDTGSGVA